jgi:peptidoglycan/LPS O-acetylase OafA/YrhL
MKVLRSDVQALRGLAVLLVVFHHLDVRLRAGYLGVDVFFVISGFLITKLVTESIRRGEFSFTEFYFRRAKRLLPAAYVTFFVTAILSVALLTSSELSSFAKQLLGAVTFTGNIALWTQTDYFATSADVKPLLHVWSLAIEEQYYMLLPAALVFCPPWYWRRAPTIVFVTSAAITVAIAPSHPSAAFYSLPTRAWELGFGTLGALGLGPLDRFVSKAFWPALIALFAVPFFPFGGPHPGIDAAVVCVATLSVIIRNHAAVGDCGPARLLAWFGDFSYSLYLVHWPVIALANNVWIGEPPAWLRVGSVVLSIVLARLLYLYVEEPTRRASPALSPRLIGGTVLASALIVLIPFRPLVADRRSAHFAELRSANFGLAKSCQHVRSFTSTPACRTADAPQILVWGDSYAMHLVAGIVKTSGGAGVEQATAHMCGPLVGVAPVSRAATGVHNERWARDCIAFNASVLEHVAASRSIKVVVLSSAFGQYLDATSNRLLDSAGLSPAEPGVDSVVSLLKGTVDTLRALGKRVIVIAPPPRGNFDIGACVERRETGKWNAGPLAECELPVALYREYREDVLSLMARLPRDAGVSVVSFDDVLCTGNTCSTSVDDAFVYRDGGHLTREGSIALATRLNLAGRLLREAK